MTPEEKKLYDEHKQELLARLQGPVPPPNDAFAPYTEAEIKEFQEPGLIPHVKAAIDRGFHVFGLTPKEKEPLANSHGYKDSKAPGNPSVMEPWNQDPNRNIGIDLGASDLTVLDFDQGEDNIPQWFKDLRTFKVRTAKGVHGYFLGARPTTKLYVDGKVIGDLKSAGGYVLAAGSAHPDGPIYTIIDDSQIADWPDQANSLLRHEPARVDASLDGLMIPYGMHDTELTRIAGLLRNAGFTATKIEEHLIDVCERRCEGHGTDYREMCRKIAQSIGKKPVELVGQLLFDDKPIPIVEGDDMEMKGDFFDTKVYEDMSQKTTPYPNPGNSDLISKTANMLVHGTSIPLAFVREPLKAVVLHALDSKLIHPAHPRLSLRGNYFSLAESEGGKTTGLEFAMQAAETIGKFSQIHFENLFRYKSETTFIRSFTSEGSIKRNKDGSIKSGVPGHSSQFLYIKEGNLVANSSDFFSAVLAQLTNLYDQEEAGTESMTNGSFSAGTVKASTVMCFTPSDFAAVFGGKGNIGGGGLNRWALVNPPPIHDYDSKDWERLEPEVLSRAAADLAAR